MINTHMANFFWNDQENNHKYHLSNWQSLTQRKEKGGGVGIPDLRNLNLCLLASWVQRYYDSGPKLWREIVDCKYNTAPNLFYCRDINVSPLLEMSVMGSSSCQNGL
jgi:hypothetical protein